MTIKRIIFSFPPIEIFLFETKNLSLSLSLEADSFFKKKRKKTLVTEARLSSTIPIARFFVRSYMSMIARTLSLEQVQSVIN